MPSRDTSVITTFAGGPGHGPADSVAQSPDAVAVHGHVVYVADTLHNVVYRVDTDTGEETAVAGTGAPGLSGDGGPAKEAELNRPCGLAVDAAGDLLIADTWNRRIRKVAMATGVITTIAGDQSATEVDLPTALAVHPSGAVYFAEASRIRAIAADGSITTVAGSGESSADGGPATEARLILPTGDPCGIAVDGDGSLYIPEPFNRRVRRVDGATGILTTVAGSEEATGSSGDGGPATKAGIESPIAVAVDAEGNVFIVDSASSNVRRVARDGTISTAVGTGTAGSSGDAGAAVDAQLDHPCAIALSAGGDLYIGDRGNARVRKVDAGSHTISSVAGNGPPLMAFIQPEGLAVDQHDNVYVSDLFPRVYKIDGATGAFTIVAGSNAGFSGDGGPAAEAELQDPWRLSVDPHGNLYITDHGNRRVRKVDVDTGVISTVAGNGQLQDPFPGGPATRNPLNFVLGTCVDRAGNLYIADAGFHCVQKVDANTGTMSPVAGELEFGRGKQGFSGDGKKATKAHLSLPAGVATDDAGHLYIADTGNHRVRRVDAATGVITTVAGGGASAPSAEPTAATGVKLGRPVHLAVDHDGNLLVCDADLHQVVLVDLAAERVRVVAGTGTPGFAGDGGSGPSASLRNPVGVAVDRSGRILIADSDNRRVRRLQPHD